MRQLKLNLAERSYSIYIGESLLTNTDLLQEYIIGDNVLILSNEIIAPIYLKGLQSVFSNTDKKVFDYLLPDGESYKTLESYSLVLDYLIKQGFRRNDTLIALGGGVIGDLGGFVAASYQRGMNFLQVPTSLLAQVDSSVGGKTAVNHKLGKNMIGAFYQPKGVFIDPLTLDSLPEREYISGLAEVVKYALLGEVKIKQLLMENTQQVIQRDKTILTELIYLSCAKKSDVVAQDEHEKGARALLNLGHTFGHAIEKVTEYKQYLHGEAIAIGICMALNLSLAKNMISLATVNDYKNLLTQLGLLEKASSNLSVELILTAMKLDKKNINDNYRLILPTDNGCIITEEHDLKLINQAISLQLEE